MSRAVEIVHGVEGSLGTVAPPVLANGGDARRDVFRVPFDPDTEDPNAVVVRSVAVIQNVEPTDLPPLGDVVDVDALEALVAPPEGSREGAVNVTFVYQGLEITVDSDGELWLEWV